MNYWRNKKLTELEREEFKQVIRNFNEEEKKITLKAMSNELLLGELTRRLTTGDNKLREIRDILRVGGE